jgi:hypothetical protein
MSDDDRFHTSINPLHVIDAAISRGDEAILFNHVNYLHINNKLNATRYYEDLSLSNDNKTLLNEVLFRLPRHIGLIYSTKLLKEKIDEIKSFENTLHLYSAPFIFAAKNDKAIFFDYPLFLFDKRKQVLVDPESNHNQHLLKIQYYCLQWQYYFDYVFYPR